MIELGQTLFYVSRSGRSFDKRDVIVTKVGRRWLTLKDADKPDGWWTARADKNTLVIDGGGYSSPGRCWLSREEYQTAVLRGVLWDAFSRAVRHGGCPDNVSADDIRAAAIALKITMTEVEKQDD